MVETTEQLLEAKRRAQSKKDKRLHEQSYEIERLRQDAAEMYQVVGVLARDILDKPDVQRALDNLLAAVDEGPRRHHDLLPWPRDQTILEPGQRPFIRYVLATHLTEEQREQGRDSRLHELGDMRLVWANQCDLLMNGEIMSEESE